MNPVIYTPKGRAREYAPLALNIFEGCPHGCRYCYGADLPQWGYGKRRAEFHQSAVLRKDLHARLRNDCEKMRGDSRPVLACFACDPYPPDAGVNLHTRAALKTLAEHDMTATVLTKGGLRACRDFDILASRGWWFGTSLNCISQPTADEWEPNAASVSERISAIQAADGMGIPVWVSVEPVVDPYEALGAIAALSPFVNHWKIGKLNGRQPEHVRLEGEIDWPRFLAEVRELLSDWTETHAEGAFEFGTYYIKRDLLEAGR